MMQSLAKPQTFLFLGLTFVVIICMAMSLSIEAIVARISIWDNFIALEGGWRVIQGQIPHQDFHSPLGPFIYYLSALGLLTLGKNSLVAITVANALILPFIALSAWYISYRRLSKTRTFLFCLLIIGLTIATRQLGWDYFAGSYSSIYSRYGYIFLLMAFLLLFVSKKEGEKKLSNLENTLLVVFSVVLAINKITFFLVLIPGFFLSNYYFFKDKFWLLKILAGWLVGMILFFLVSGIPVSSLIQDYYWGKLAVDPEIPSLLKYGFKLLFWDISSYVILLICGVLFYLEKRNYAMLWCYFILSSLFLFMTTGESTEMPLYGLTVFILGAMIPPLPSPQMLLKTPSKFLLALEKNKTGLVLFISIFFFTFSITAQDFMSLYRQFNNSESKLQPDIMPISGMLLLNYPGEMNWKKDTFNKEDVVTRLFLSERYPPGEFRQILMDGITLLQKNMTLTDKIFSWEFHNPFPFIFSSPSPKKNLVWWHLGKSISPLIAFEPSDFLNDATLIMVPKRSVHIPTLEMMNKRYGDYLNQNFTYLDESHLWKLYRKK